MERSKIFLSWSGERSKKVAGTLGSWIEDVLQTIEPFMSDTDIAAGDLWFDQIGANLEASQFAVICVTPENANSKWLHFEAGAIGMTRTDGARAAVVPYLVGLSTADLTPPLSLFQSVPADKHGTLRLVQAINATLAIRLEAPRLERTFDRWWPDLENALSSIPEPAGTSSTSAARSDREVLEELLSLVRQGSSASGGFRGTASRRSADVRGRLDDARTSAQQAKRYGVIDRRLRGVLHPFDVKGWELNVVVGKSGRVYVEVDCVLPPGLSRNVVQEALQLASDEDIMFTLGPKEIEEPGE